MVTKVDFEKYYEEKRGEQGCPRIVRDYLDTLHEDETGIYSLISEFVGNKEYYDLDSLKTDFSHYVDQTIKDLEQIKNL